MPPVETCTEDVALPRRFAKTHVAEFYRDVRGATDSICAPLEIEDYGLQSMPDASPVKWHLAHTTWFFETFVLQPSLPGYRSFHPQFGFLFNSYYNAVGPRWPRPQRGLLSRPTVGEVIAYRTHVDQNMELLMSSMSDGAGLKVPDIVLLGCHHEQQHLELLLTDLKHAWAGNPLDPIYHPAQPVTGSPPPSRWVPFPEGIFWLGHEGDDFAFDNEDPRHRVFLEPFELSSRLVTNGEYFEFMQSGGYDRPELWLSDGWAARQAGGWEAPLYWESCAGDWFSATLSGRRPIALTEPVCHVSYYEADAFARWAGARLPTEAEWERAASTVELAGHFLEADRFHPSGEAAADDHGPLYQLFGDTWQWTASPYTAYPGYEPAAGALGEYNGKFMINQMVLRGASCVTPRSHARRTYRNFFPPATRWQFSGIRLARRSAYV